MKESNLVKCPPREANPEPQAYTKGGELRAPGANISGGNSEPQEFDFYTKLNCKGGEPRAPAV